MIKTYVDTNVLLYAAKSNGTIGINARKVLDDPDREFVSSSFIILEVMPHAMYGKKNREIKFYDRFFKDVKTWAGVPKFKYPKSFKPVLRSWNLYNINRQAFSLAAKYGLGGMDAIHVACALSLGADEFVTGEGLTKPFFRVKEGHMKIVSIAPPSPVR